MIDLATRLALVLGLVAAAAVASIPGAARAEEKRMQRTITVSGMARVAAEPDVARLTSGVTSEAETAREALARNTDAMRKVVAALKGKGIEPRDIQTSAFRVEPKYSTPKDRAPAIVGYRVVNQVHVAVRDLARLGEILDELVGSGANQLGGLDFEVTKADTLKDAARTEAVANALRKARLLAGAAGAEIGDVVTIAEDFEQGPMPGHVMTRAAPKAMAVPIEAGTELLEARVTVTWSLK
jgi:uncharacterized protein YggE